ncbi:phenylalanyl-tRNA synthetase alpha subunit, mitochondrial [Neophaeococcomyces mojaviensis]|uniref:Phenylalanyl-tRNA synthetase alpha subunit, mitochondrial n=1 Tax=Neophaeococcomyces mojaviensis TaxID=3383035 RepID=A0ACC3A0B4_9EURO|nr:phenylalanyl-tRNA synthetase alpha subunit, mitochondrial [Knufia sp. JES_112]
MHLARTGVFLWAVRSARLLALPVQRISLIDSKRWLSHTPRCLSSPFAAFPEQSAQQGSKVDPKKTEKTSASDHGNGSIPESQFQRSLASAPQNKIIHDTTGSGSGANILGQPFVFDDVSNVTDSILGLVGRNLYDTPNHPLHITRKLIESVFQYPLYKNHIASNPVVTTKDNFDVLGFPKDHPGRSRTDTYYVDSQTVLRTHTSAHQHAAFQYMSQNPEKGYTICADVYRRDSIDRSHFPVFHQMEGARMWQQYRMKTTKGGTRLMGQEERKAQIKEDLDNLPEHSLEIIDEGGHHNYKTNPVQISHDEKESELVVQHLKRSLELLVQRVFTAAQEAMPGTKQEQLKVRWVEAYFPFTSPSFELEVFWQGEWLELLGCGVTKQEILNNAGLNDRIGWAWGIGVERLAMLLFEIPDIRLFWSQDERFLSQFKEGQITRFKPFSKYPPCYKDVSFWVRPSPDGASPIGAESSSGVAAAAGGDSTKASPAETQPAAFHENDIMEVVRNVAGTLVEDVKLVDEFVSPKTSKKSLCYRINYRSNERTLTNEEVNSLHDQVLQQLTKLPIEIR